MVPQVAIVGARGTGRFHAAWWALAGARVCAVSGTSKHKLVGTCHDLRMAFGFDGEAYDSVEEMVDAEAPDIVDIFRRESEIPGVVEEAIEVGAKVVWFQLGLRHDEAAQMAIDAGLQVVQDRCLKIEHARFSGGLHLGGFDTGIISSKRRRPV